MLLCVVRSAHQLSPCQKTLAKLHLLTAVEHCVFFLDNPERNCHKVCVPAVPLLAASVPHSSTADTQSGVALVFDK